MAARPSAPERPLCLPLSADCWGVLPGFAIVGGPSAGRHRSKPPRGARGGFAIARLPPAGAVPVEGHLHDYVRFPAWAESAPRPVPGDLAADRAARPCLLPARQVPAQERGAAGRDAGPVLAVVRPPRPPGQERDGVRQRRVPSGHRDTSLRITMAAALPAGYELLGRRGLYG